MEDGDHDLVALAYRYYPRWDAARESPDSYDARYRSAPETRARLAAEESALRDISRWHAFVRALDDELAGMRARDYTPRAFPAFEAVVNPPSLVENGVEKMLVICASMLAPYYFIYESHLVRVNGSTERVNRYYEPTADFADVARLVDRELADKLGLQRLDPDRARTPLPDITVGDLELGEVTLADALFTPFRW